MWKFFFSFFFKKGKKKAHAKKTSPPRATQYREKVCLCGPLVEMQSCGVVIFTSGAEGCEVGVISEQTRHEHWIRAWARR